LNGERIAHWMERGAQPTPKVHTLIKKYGKGGTHLAAQQQAIERLGQRRAKSIQSAIAAAANAPKAPEPSAAPAETAAEAPAEESTGGEEAASEYLAACSPDGAMESRSGFSVRFSRQPPLEPWFYIKLICRRKCDALPADFFSYPSMANKLSGIRR
ncbi:MAG: hypothetical protein ACKO9H_06600, partial [Planctomycetota bacterium]